ncbi:hypothetical protein COCNU_10G001290 [Cocos nucifera]|uniref:Uncharacterized protein n=1 Tax=Cocos nucifera TaxID=13894 RepID=A0A8K0IL16_COCNU|nr:hypothetical protein COCNU_10G001290 [Cocos nucifera]
MEKPLASSSLHPSPNFSSNDDKLSQRWPFRRWIGKKKGRDENELMNAEPKSSAVSIKKSRLELEQEQQQQQNRLMPLCFAPQLDGLHFFETMVSH